MLTTTIGAFPTPGYVPVTDWFSERDGDFTSAYRAELERAGDRADELFDRATVEVVRAQVAAGIDVPTDGEIRRENYIHYHCRHLEGIDFDRLAAVRMRGMTDALLPTVTGPIVAGASPLNRDYAVAQAATDRPVKMTLPGPMTIIDSTSDAHYGDDAALARDLATALNTHILELAATGCTWIQVDEPVMARRSAEALDWGVHQLGRCFDGLPSEVTRVAHVCCGYPDHLDQVGYAKAPLGAYVELAEALAAAPIDVVSIEDAHRHNDLADLLPRFGTTSVMLGVVAIASSRLESVEEIRVRLAEALERAGGEVIAAPDCGLGYLPTELALAKLRNLATAAHSIPGARR